MHKFNVTRTKTRATLVEVELDFQDPATIPTGLIPRVAKKPTQVAWVLDNEGKPESRVYGHWVFVDLRPIREGMLEGDELALLEDTALKTMRAIPPTLVVFRAQFGEVKMRGMIVLCGWMGENNEGLIESYMNGASMPAMQLCMGAAGIEPATRAV